MDCNRREIGSYQQRLIPVRTRHQEDRRASHSLFYSSSAYLRSKRSYSNANKRAYNYCRRYREALGVDIYRSDEGEQAGELLLLLIISRCFVFSGVSRAAVLYPYLMQVFKYANHMQSRWPTM